MLFLVRQILKAGVCTEKAPEPNDAWRIDGERIQGEILRLLGRALTIRQVDAGSCNGCELEIQALHNPYYNLEGRGVRFVASPRHADLLLVTGPVTPHMHEALERTWAAMSEPKRLLAVGDCAIDGGVFGQGYASLGGVAQVLEVDATVPGCPPAPEAILEGIRRALAVERRSPVPTDPSAPPADKL